MFDEDLATAYEANCDFTTLTSMITFSFTEAVPLQTVGLKVEITDTAMPAVFGSIHATDADGNEHYCCPSGSTLDGFYACAVWAQSVTIATSCVAGGRGLAIREIGLFPYAEAGAFGLVQTIYQDGTAIDTSYNNLFGASYDVTTAGSAGFFWQGSELTIELFSSMPIVATIAVPSYDTTAMDMQSRIDDSTETYDFFLGAYPTVSVYGDYSSFIGQSMHIISPNAGSQYLDRMAIFTGCSSLDETVFMLTNVDGTTCQLSTSLTDNADNVWCEGDYNLAELNGEFNHPLPTWTVSTYSLS
jgi:hypothetical protein